MSRDKNRLKTGKGGDMRDSQYKALVKDNGITIYVYSLPEYHEMQLQKMKEYILKRFYSLEYVAIYEAQCGRNSDPIQCLNVQRGNQWQPYDDFLKSCANQKCINAHRNNTRKEKPSYKPKYNLWIPLKSEHRKGNHKGHIIGSVDIDPETGEVLTDYAAVAAIIPLFFNENWDKKLNGTARLYLNDGSNKEIGFLSLEKKAIFYTHSTIPVGESPFMTRAKKMIAQMNFE